MGTVGFGSEKRRSPGPPRTRARARMEQQAEVVLTGLEAATTRIDDSSDDKPLMPTWRDEVSPCAEVGRSPDVRNAWARVGESHAAVVPTLLDSLGLDQEPSNPIPADVDGHTDDECRSARSESCWAKMDDVGDDEVVDWGVTHPMSSVHVVPAPHALSCDRVAVRAEPKGRSKVKRSHLIRHSQRETVAASSLPSSRNRFGALDDEVDFAHNPVGDVEGTVVAIRGPTSVEACDRWAFPADAAPTRRTKRPRIQMRESHTGFHCPCSFIESSG